MDGLRLALLIAGAALIGGIYVFSRLSRRGAGERGGREPRRGTAGEDPDTGTREPRREPGGADSEPVSREPYRGADGGSSESATREPYRDAEVSEPVSREPDYDTGGGDPDTATREPAGSEDSESRAWEPYDEAGTGESNAASRETRRGAEASEPNYGTGGEDPDTIGHEPGRDLEGGARERHTALDPRSVDDDYDVDALGGMFTPRRKTSSGELSVDVSILSGMRASYEGTVDDSVPPAPGKGEGQPSLDASRPIVFLTLVAKRGRLPGHAILDAFDAEGFRPGPMRIYHYHGHPEPGPPVAFGVANLVEPGVLEPDSLPGIETPGLVMFMGVEDDAAGASRTLEAMIAAGRRLAHRLDATLCDETRSILTAQAENHLHERVADIARRGRSGG